VVRMERAAPLAGSCGNCGRTSRKRIPEVVTIECSSGALSGFAPPPELRKREP
jgi:hypothetical protein